MRVWPFAPKFVLLGSLALGACYRATGFCDTHADCQAGWICSPQGECQADDQAGVLERAQVGCARRFGGVGKDHGGLISADGSGNVVLYGSFSQRADFGGPPLVSGAGVNGFLARYGPDCAHLWSRQIPLSARAVMCDRAGNVVLAGSFQNTVDLDGVQLTSAGSFDVFVAVFAAADGHLLWARRFGGSSDEHVYGMALNAAGGVAMLGSFSGTTDLGNGPLGPLTAFFVAQYDAQGGHLWSKIIDQANAGVMRGTPVLALDQGRGLLFLALSGSGSLDFGGGSLTSLGDTDIFLASFQSSDGSHLWSKRLGSAQAAESAPIRLGVTSNADVVMAGEFQQDTDLGTGPITSNLLDQYLAKYSFLGEPLWVRGFGGMHHDYMRDMAVDSRADGMVTLDRMDVSQQDGVGRMFVSRRAADGNDVWRRQLPSPAVPSRVIVDKEGGVAVTGSFSNTINLGASTLTSAGSDDVFLLRLAP